MDSDFDLLSDALALEAADTYTADSQVDNQAVKQMAQFLATEYAALQSARSALVAESNGRTGTFLNAISAGFVALALILNISQFGETFLLFALALIPILGFIGLSAYVRVVQIDYADVAYTTAMNRIRHFHLQTTPEIEPYLSFPAFDDERSVFRARVIYTNLVWRVISYPSGLILVINSLLAGVLVALLVTMLFQTPVTLAAGVGVLSFLLASFQQYRLALKWLADVRADFQPRFPDPSNATPDAEGRDAP